MFWVSLQKIRIIKKCVFTLKFFVHIGNNKYLYTRGNFQLSWKFSNRMKKYLPKYVLQRNVHTGKKIRRNVPRRKSHTAKLILGEMSVRRSVLTAKNPTSKCPVTWKSALKKAVSSTAKTFFFILATRVPLTQCFYNKVSGGTNRFVIGDSSVCPTTVLSTEALYHFTMNPCASLKNIFPLTMLFTDRWRLYLRMSATKDCISYIHHCFSTCLYIY